MTREVHNRLDAEEILGPGTNGSRRGGCDTSYMRSVAPKHLQTLHLLADRVSTKLPVNSELRTTAFGHHKVTNTGRALVSASPRTGQRDRGVGVGHEKNMRGTQVSFSECPPAREWFQPIRLSPTAMRLRLFCFPYAGGGASAYRQWNHGFPEGIDVHALQLPGRETRISESAIDELSVLLERLVAAIQQYLDFPFAFFGHSMGALIGWELARSLRSSCDIEPTHIFVSGSHAIPRVRNELGKFGALPDAVLIAELKKLNGTPAEVLENPELISLILPAIRADFRLLSSYVYQPGELLHCPITVLGGDGDPSVPPHELSAWATLTTGDVDIRVLPGGHFFLHTSRDEILALISARLARPLKRPSYAGNDHAVIGNE